MLVIVERWEERSRKRLVEFVGASLVPGFYVARNERGETVEVAVDTVERVIMEEKLEDSLAGAVVIAEQVAGESSNGK